jgi:hypothetical protein
MTSLNEWLSTPIEELQLDLEDELKTGYDNPEGRSAPEDDESFSYKAEILATRASIIVTVSRDQKPYASIACDSIAEAEWFKERLQGRRPRS